MKRSLSLVLFTFLFLYFGSSALGQSYEIELAVSYDQQYKDTYQQDINNPFESVDARINAIVDGLDKVYSNYGVYFKLVAIEEFGYINLSGTTVDPPNV